MQLGKYQLVRKLATGGMAEVYLAKAAGPMGFEKTLVLKRILPHLAEDPAFVEMFLGEAKLAAQLEHPNVVQIFDFGEAEGSFFLAMEFIDGVNLRKLVKRAVDTPLPPALCAKVVASAAEGLAYAHEFCDPATGMPLGLIHRDVSPDNILVSRQGAVKVVDFGIAKVAGQSHRTQTGVVKGKVAYMPPEQLQTRPLDRRVDVYALGIVLYELLTGKRPFEATTDVSVMQAIMFESFVPAVERRADLPVALQQVLEKALAKDRERRYPDCRALQLDLERYVMSTGEPVGAYQVAQLVVKMLAEGAGGTVGVTPPAAVVHGPAPLVTSPLPASRPSMVAPMDSTSPTTPMPISMRAVFEPPPPPVEAMAPEPRSTVKELPALGPVVEAGGAGLATGGGGAARGEARARVPEAVPPSMLVGERPTDPVTPESRIDADDAVHTGSAEVTVPRPAKRSGRLVPAAVGGVLLAAGVGFLLLRSEEPAVVPESPPPVEQKVDGRGSVERVVEAPPVREAAQPASETRPAVGGEAAGEAQAPSEAPPTAAPVAPVAAEKGPAEPTKPEAVAAPAGKEPVSKPVEPVAQVVKQKAPAVPAPAPRKKEARPPRAVASSAPAAKGTLEFRIRPYAVVSLDGKVLGQTPFAPIEVPEGTYTLRLVNKELGKDVEKTFKVRAGQPNIFKLNLEAE